MWQARTSGLFIVLIQFAICACSTAPVGDRSRVIDIPMASVQSDIEFSLVNRSRVSQMSCADNPACPEAFSENGDVRFNRNVAQIAGPLQATAMKLYPDLAWCTRKAVGGCFDVYLVDNETPGSSSSANGRIILNSGLVQAQPDETVLAFVIAREMGHVIARHHEERSSVSIVTSVLLNVLIPGSGLVKSVISTGIGRIAAASNRDVQIVEADAIALNLLKGSGIAKRDVARSLLGTRAITDDSTWTTEFRRSSSKLITEVGQEDFALALFSNETPVDHSALSVSLAPQPSSDALLERTAAMGRPAMQFR